MIGIIDYKAGNIGSVSNALDRLNVKYFLSSDTTELENADKIIFPGVGSAKYSMENLKKYGLAKFLLKINKKVLGICLGLQLLYQSSEEGNAKGLGIIKGNVKRFSKDCLVVPQIGWNKVNYQESNELFRGIDQGSFFYFVHSYYVPLGENTIATSDYGIIYTSAIKKDNFYAVQFHPEKSGEVGEKLLKNFINL